MATPLPGVAALRQDLPGLPLGLEEPGLRLAQARRLLDLAARNQILSAPARGLALWAWQRSPLEREACALVREGRPSPPAEALAARLDALLAAPFPEEDWNALLASGEHGLVVRQLLPRLRAPGSGQAWLARTWDWLLRLGNADLPRDMLEATAWDPDLAALKQRLLAEWAVFYAPAAEALGQVETLDSGAFGLWREQAAAVLLQRLDRADEARARLAGLWRKLPWHPHLILCLHALLHAPAPATDARDVRLLLYSWNKRDLLRATLESLAAGELLGAPIVVLDNGSQDGTSEMLAQAASRFPAGCLESLRLPVNIGAPGARNWLLALPRVRESRYVCFLDDDVVLPRDWLPRLLGSALAAPWAGVVGCRIVSAAAPACLQSADYNLLPGRYGQETYPGFPENIHLLENAAGGLDLGLFAYRRRTLSVSGCCHLLRTDTLDSVGRFDLRFSPTQFDDLERDIRANLAGVPVLYDGTVSIGHVQHSSLAKASSAAAVGQVAGNKVKLECLYTREQVQGLAEGGLTRLWDDLAAKERELAEALGG